MMSRNGVKAGWSSMWDALDKEGCRIVRNNVIWAQDKLKKGN